MKDLGHGANVDFMAKAFNKNTKADPSVVPRNGISIPMLVISMLFM